MTSIIAAERSSCCSGRDPLCRVTTEDPAEQALPRGSDTSTPPWATSTLWSSNLTSFASHDRDTSTLAIVQSSARLLVLLALALGVLFSCVVAWQVVRANNSVLVAVEAGQEEQVQRFQQFFVSAVVRKLEALHRLSLASALYSNAYFQAWSMGDRDLVQLRQINADGWEVVRVDFGMSTSTNGVGSDQRWTARPIPPELLQDKSDRSYTGQALQLSPSSVYMSPFELNVENGEIEVPFRPVYRIAASTGDSINDTGFLIANLDALRLWQTLNDDVASGSLQFAMDWHVLDSKLHWLASSRADVDYRLYGGSIPERAHLAYKGPLRVQVEGELAALESAGGSDCSPSIIRSGMDVALVLHPSAISCAMPGLTLAARNTSVVVLMQVEDGEVWRLANASLRPFYVAIAFAYLAAFALAALAVIFWKTTDLRKRQNQQSHAFLASMSHDLRSPLHVMSSALHLLQTEELSQKYEFRALQAAVESMLSLLSNTVFIYRNAGDSHVPPQKRNLRDDLVALVEVNAFIANEQDLYLELEMSDDLPNLVMIQWIGVKQVLANLLSNAIKFTSLGGVIVRAWVSQDEGNQASLCIAVEDTGPGLPESSPNSLAAGDPKAKKSKGSLGLGICQRIADNLGFSIEVHSAPGRGCVFTLDGLACEVLEPASMHPVWRELSLARKLDYMAVLGDEGHDVAPFIRSFVAKLQRTEPKATLRVYYPRDLNGSMPPIPKGSVVFIGNTVFQDEKLMLSMAAEMHKGRCLAVVLSFVCGSTSLTSAAGFMDKAFPTHTFVYPPWTPERMALQILSTKTRETTHTPVTSGNKPGKWAGRPSAPDFSGLRTLVVDDMAVNRAMVKRLLLKQFHIKAADACDGEACLKVFKEDGGFDLVLMDLHMPGLDGCETTVALRQLEASLGMRPATVIGLSASVLSNDRKQCIQSGMDDYYCKPMSVEQFTTVFEALLEKKLSEESSSCSSLASSINPSRATHGGMLGRGLSGLMPVDSRRNSRSSIENPKPGAVTCDTV